MGDLIQLTQPVQIPARFEATQYRSGEIVDMDKDEGILTARIAPYETEAQLDARLFETFGAGCFARAAAAPGRCKVWHEHGGSLIGCAREIEDKTDGIWVRAKFSNTLAGQEARELASDGSLDQCSVEFKALKDWLKVERRSDGLHVRHARAQLFGFALTTRGIYGEGGFIASVRSDEVDREREQILAALRARNH